MRITEKRLRSMIRHIFSKDSDSDHLTVAQRQGMMQREKEALKSLLESIKLYLYKADYKVGGRKKKIDLFDNLSMAAGNFREEQLKIGEQLEVDVEEFISNLSFWKKLHDRVSKECCGGHDLAHVANEMRKVNK